MSSLIPVPKQIPRQTSKKARLFLTADEHYFHGKILIYEDRPFPDVLTMNTALITNHNSVVRPEDHVIHIGDICFGHKAEFISIIRALNGRHYVLDGSHDRSLAEYFHSEDKPRDVEAKLMVLPKLFEFSYNGSAVSLLHYAMARWQKSHYGSYHFYGHSHGKYKCPKGKAIDVGVDCHNYFPILIEDAMALADNCQTETFTPRQPNP